MFTRVIFTVKETLSPSLAFSRSLTCQVDIHTHTHTLRNVQFTPCDQWYLNLTPQQECTLTQSPRDSSLHERFRVRKEDKIWYSRHHPKEWKNVTSSDVLSNNAGVIGGTSHHNVFIEFLRRHSSEQLDTVCDFLCIIDMFLTQSNVRITEARLFYVEIVPSLFNYDHRRPLSSAHNNVHSIAHDIRQQQSNHPLGVSLLLCTGSVKFNTLHLRLWHSSRRWCMCTTVVIDAMLTLTDHCTRWVQVSTWTHHTTVTTIYTSFARQVKVSSEESWRVHTNRCNWLVYTHECVHSSNGSTVNEYTKYLIIT